MSWRLMIRRQDMNNHKTYSAIISASGRPEIGLSQWACNGNVYLIDAADIEQTVDEVLRYCWILFKRRFGIINAIKLALF